MATRTGRVTPRKPRPAPQVDIGLDPGKLTVGDLEDLEEHFGITLDSLMESARDVKTLSAKFIAALAFILKRQIDPDFSPAEARKIRLEEIFGWVGADVETAVADARKQVKRLAGTGAPVRRDPTPAG